MYYLTVLLFLLGGTLSVRTLAVAVSVEEKPDGVSDVIHDCLNFEDKDLTARIWSTTFPDGVRSLTVQNCENLVLNIATGGETKRSLQYLAVRNVKNCAIVGSEKCEGSLCTSLPSHAIFTNVDRMTVNVPLYDKVHFKGGVLQFKNVTITCLKTNSIGFGPSSLKKFSIAGSTLVMADRESIVFHGSCDSLLEIKDSFFYSVDENFIVCNVTNAIIKRNYFICAKEGSFSLKTKNVIIAGNKAFEVEDCTFKLFTEVVDQGNTIRNCTDSDSLKGKICLRSSAENMRKLTLSSSEDDPDANRNKTGSTSNVADKNNTVAEETNWKVSSFVERFGNGIFLIWFLALVLLTLMFPVAFFLKNLIFKIVDNAFYFDIKHKSLSDEEEG